MLNLFNLDKSDIHQMESHYEILRRKKDENQCDITCYNPYTMLKIACQKGELDMVTFLSARCDSIKQNDYEIIHISAKSGNLKIVKHFCKTYQTDHNVWQISMGVAAEYNHMHIVKYLCEKCPYVDPEIHCLKQPLNSYNAWYYSSKMRWRTFFDLYYYNHKLRCYGRALEGSVKNNHVDIVTYLIDNYSHIYNLVGELHHIYKIIENKNLQLAKYFHKHIHLSPEIMDVCLTKSITYNLLEFVKYFSQYVCYTKSKTHYVALAIRSGNVEIVKYLCSQFIDINTIEISSHLFARRNTRADMIWCLLDVGLDIHKNSNFLLGECITNGYIDIVEYLCEHNVDVNDNNNFALKQAIRENRAKIVRCLIKYGANIHVVEPMLSQIQLYAWNHVHEITYNATCLLYIMNMTEFKDAIKRCSPDDPVMCKKAKFYFLNYICIGNLEMVKYLAEYYVNINTDVDKKYCMHLAQKNGDTALVSYFL